MVVPGIGIDEEEKNRKFHIVLLIEKSITKIKRKLISQPTLPHVFLTPNPFSFSSTLTHSLLIFSLRHRCLQRRRGLPL